MQFQVPQFIDVEDKIIGPLTIKQFMYILFAGLIIFILYHILNLVVVIFLSIPIIFLAIALAFVKVHNQPFINVVKSFLGFLKKPDFYVWKKQTLARPEEKELPQIIKKGVAKKRTKPMSKENLQEIGWKVEIEK